MSIFSEEKGIAVRAVKLHQFLNMPMLLIHDSSLLVFQIIQPVTELLDHIEAKKGVEAFQEYRSLRTTGAPRLNTAVSKTREALKQMGTLLKPLVEIENLAKDLDKKLQKARSLTATKQAKEEETLFAYATGVESAMKLNIQRCEAINEHLNKLIKVLNNQQLDGSFKNLPNFIATQPANYVKFAKLTSAHFNNILAELRNIIGWCNAALKALALISGTLTNIGKLERKIMMQQKI